MPSLVLENNGHLRLRNASLFDHEKLLFSMLLLSNKTSMVNSSRFMGRNVTFMLSVETVHAFKKKLNKTKVVAKLQSNEKNKFIKVRETWNLHALYSPSSSVIELKMLSIFRHLSRSSFIENCFLRQHFFNASGNSTLNFVWCHGIYRIYLNSFLGKNVNEYILHHRN